MFKHPFTRLKNPASWRRISIANWNSPNDPTVYGSIDIDFSCCLDFLKKVNANSDVKVSATHVMAKAIALVLRKFPDLNGIVRWNRIYLRKTVDIFLQVSIEAQNIDEKPDLSGAKIEECDKKNITDIARELKDKSQQIRSKKDPQFKKTLGLFQMVPDLLLGIFVKVASFLIYNLDIHLPKIGLTSDPFGSAMVTSVGMLGIPPGFAPLVPASRCPLILCLGEIKDQPWVENGQLTIKPVGKLAITFDHRFIDGLTGSKMIRHLEEILQNPDAFL